MLDLFYVRAICSFVIINVFMILYDTKKNIIVRLCWSFACELR
jgi:hypothetical protein